MTDQTLRNASAPSNGHAVVVGAGIAGLVAAQALASTFARITVIDRDTLPAEPGPRRGVPQSRQVHGLLGGGASALEELFPGFQDELVAAGGALGDGQVDHHWFLDGFRLRTAPSDIPGYGASRPLIESVLRNRVAALPGVRITDDIEVVGLAADGPDRVAGVRVTERRADAQETVLSADLVVDASGRGSRAGVWLSGMGHPQPEESTVRIDLVYVTRHYTKRPELLGGRRLGVSVVPSPALPRMGVVMPEEGDRYALLLAGMFGEEPPTDDAGMLEYARSLASPEVAAVIESATPLDEPARMRFPAGVRKHYEKLKHHPEGFVVMGDALCSFNPAYGQGMTVAAMEGVLLRRLLSEGTAQLPGRFFRAAAKLVDTPWALATGGDLRFPQVEGKRPPGDKLINKYLERYRAAASVDPGLAATFLRVANLIEPPGRLLHPAHVLRVLRYAPKATQAAQAAHTARHDPAPAHKAE
ncbi:FAD-binding monooxygenase [Streptomyces sp. Tu 6176]|uniref:FAD-dependent oxidoreductase n=1 Tax=Streptomyces sp. Tu 6176 TaxID=1470557 RepID=UPI00044A2839|nr:FAD-dependent monooxygenase [Streptomyces sp. Tu 6176]EYT81801.1 FAD-binding monooxygenase [Streptomyces sp. Tu 6176]